MCLNLLLNIAWMQRRAFIRTSSIYSISFFHWRPFIFFFFCRRFILFFMTFYYSVSFLLHYNLNSNYQVNKKKKKNWKKRNEKLCIYFIRLLFFSHLFSIQMTSYIIIESLYTPTKYDVFILGILKPKLTALSWRWLSLQPSISSLNKRQNKNYYKKKRN